MATTRVVVSTAGGFESVEYRTVGTGVVTSRGLEPVAGSDQSNAATLVARARTALTQNATYLALPSPSAAQQTAQIDRLTLGRTESLTDS